MQAISHSINQVANNLIIKNDGASTSIVSNALMRNGNGTDIQLRSYPLSKIRKEPPLTDDSKPRFALMLSAVFSIDYLAKDTADAMKFDLLFEMAKEEGYSLKEFNTAFIDFMKRVTYATWTPAEFFKRERAKTYTWNQVLELSGGTTRGFKCVEIDSKKYWVRDEVEI